MKKLMKRHKNPINRITIMFFSLSMLNLFSETRNFIFLLSIRLSRFFSHLIVSINFKSVIKTNQNRSNRTIIPFWFVRRKMYIQS